MDSGLKRFTDPVSLIRFLDPLESNRHFSETRSPSDSLKFNCCFLSLATPVICVG